MLEPRVVFHFTKREHDDRTYSFDNAVKLKGITRNGQKPIGITFYTSSETIEHSVAILKNISFAKDKSVDIIII